MERTNDPDLEVAPDDVLVMQNGGPVGGPGVPEAGYIPIPGKLLQLLMGSQRNGNEHQHEQRHRH